MNGEHFPIALQSASTLSGRVDTLFYSLLGLSVVAIGGVVATMIYFSVKYRRGSKADRTRPSQGERRIIENTWIIVPLCLFMIPFFWGAELFRQEQTPPADAREVFLVAKQWMWKLQHMEGQREIDELHVPRGVPIKLVMISQDVIHSFYIPAFRLKQDVLPGRYTVTWFEATKSGVYRFLCAEYCGAHHADMHGKVIVMEPADYARWLQETRVSGGLAGEGAQRFRQYGCSGCHGEHADVHAPTLEGVYGRAVALRGGAVVTADERYLRESILKPSERIVEGYDDIMPSFDGQIKEEEIQQLIAYIKSLSLTKETRNEQ